MSRMSRTSKQGRTLAAATVILGLGLGLTVGTSPASATVMDATGRGHVEPLAQAHAHNDYEHDRPLLRCA